jgi:hypothetical protein
MVGWFLEVETVNAFSRELLFYKLLWGLGFSILFIMFVYRFLSGDSLRGLVSPDFLSLIFSFLALLVSVSFAFGTFVDLKRSLEENLAWVAENNLYFFLAFMIYVVISSILLFTSAIWVFGGGIG